MSDAEKLAAAEKRATDAEAAVAAAEKRATDAEAQVAAANDAAADDAHKQALAAKDAEIDAAAVQLKAATDRVAELEASDAALDAVRTYLKDRDEVADDAVIADPAAYLVAKDAEGEKLAKAAEVKAERVAALDGLLPAERIEARADYFAGLPDEDWTAALDDLKANAPETGPAHRTPVIPGLALASVQTGSGVGATVPEVKPAIDAASDPLGVVALQTILADRPRD